MIKTDPNTLDVLFKIKGWHLQRGKKVSNSDVVRDLILKDAEQKGINNQSKGGGRECEEEKS